MTMRRNTKWRNAHAAGAFQRPDLALVANVGPETCVNELNAALNGC